MTQAGALDALIEAVEAGRINGETPHCDLPAMHILGAYVGSLDAANALHEVLLPRWMWLARKTDSDDVAIGQCTPGNGGFANVWHNVSPNDGGEHFSVFAETPARAWLLATLKAYRAGV